MIHPETKREKEAASMSVNDEKKTLKSFSTPSDREKKEIKAGLFWCAGPIFYLRIIFRILLYIGVHAFFVTLSVLKITLNDAFWIALPLLSIAFISFILVVFRIYHSEYEETDDLPTSDNMMKFWVLTALLDLTMFFMSAIFRTNVVYMIIYSILAVVSLILLARKLLNIYRFEVGLSSVIRSGKYEVMGAEIMRRRIENIENYRHEYGTLVARFYYLEVRADNGVDYTVQPRWSTYRSVKEGTRGYLLSYHEGLNKDEDTPMMIFCKVKKSKE